MKTKYILIALILVLVVSNILTLSYALTLKERREQLYIQFGPQLIEAVVLVTKDEINILRNELGLPERTNEQLVTAIENKLENIELYDWQKDYSG